MSTGNFKRTVQVGRVVLLNHGKEAGKLAVIADIIDHNRALIDGPTTGVQRQQWSFKRLTLTDIVVKQFPRGAGTGFVKKSLLEQDVAAQWAKTSWAKKIEQRTKRAAMNDFDRFKLLSLRRQKNKILRKHVRSLRKEQQKK